MLSHLQVKFISSSQCLDLRTRILRPGQDIQHCQYAEDNHPDTFHLGVFDSSQKIICNGTFIKTAQPFFPTAKNPYRLRGMATDTFYQGKGLGSLLLEKAFQILKERHCDLLWCNARESAFAFYQRSDFQLIGDMFDIPGAGPHKVMWREIYSAE